MLGSCNLNYNKARTHMGISRGGILNPAFIKDFLVKDDDGGKPRRGA